MTSKKAENVRNLVSYWWCGLCNNFVYVIMLSAAKDILSKGDRLDNHEILSNRTDDVCVENMESRQCAAISTGAVLFCSILPALFFKFFAPFFVEKFPYGVRVFIVIILQAVALMMSGLANSVLVAMIGVVVASIGMALGEITLLALTSHYSKHTISTWSSGTGMAGLAPALLYAVMTDSRYLDLTPETTLLAMMIVPILFFVAYYIVLVRAPTVPEAHILKPHSWILSDVVPEVTDGDTESTSAKSKTFSKGAAVVELLVFMIPLAVVYVSQYFINQGLGELIVFDCAHSFNTGITAQYRWYQVLYQFGVFITRTAVSHFRLGFAALMTLPFIQSGIALGLFFHTLHPFIPHIWMVFVVILVEGLVGGSAYANTMHQIRKKISGAQQEFSLMIASFASTFGVVVAATISIPIHNYICTLGV